MIEYFDVKNFKCHDGLNSFYFPGLTVVCGTNNSGKSSLLQSVYILTLSRSDYVPILMLNDDLKLGTFSEILNKEKGNKDTIEFCISFDKEVLAKENLEKLSVNFIYVNPSILCNINNIQGLPVLLGEEIEYKEIGKNTEYLELKLIDDKFNYYYSISGNLEKGYCKVKGIVPDLIVYEDINLSKRRICTSEFEKICYFISLINKHKFKYLKAFRTGEYIGANNSGESGVGIGGQYTAEIISKNWDSYLDFYDEKNNKFRFCDLFDKWVNIIMGDSYRVRSKRIDKDKYKIVVEEPDYGFEYDLSQVGFGISQILPIITLIFTSNINDVIIIENPEIHLHPKLQGDLVDLFIFCMMSNRKIIIETHSEHIINRIRLRIKQNPALRGKINIYFFEREEEVIKYQSIEVDTEGKIEYWPKDFFDQGYYDMLGLIK